MHETDPHKQLASALGRVPSGLFVVTACQGEQTTGMLASWVQQCSFDPPQVSMAVGRNRDVSSWLTEGAPFVVNVLDSTQTDMIVHFGKGFAPGVPAFTGLEIEASASGPPILSEALAYLECRVVSRCSGGDHDLVIGRVSAGRLLGDGQDGAHPQKRLALLMWRQVCNLPCGGKFATCPWAELASYKLAATRFSSCASAFSAARLIRFTSAI